MIETLNNIANTWYNWQLNMLWQVGTLIIIVAALDALLRKWAWPQVRYALWLLVLVKLLIWPGFALSTSIISPLTPIDRQAIQQPANKEIAPELFTPEITPHETATTTEPVNPSPLSQPIPPLRLNPHHKPPSKYPLHL
ncbi:MAG: hypothetical protein K9M57_00140 [Phycisphaerae bacterium]|nr:hypothetical protein [Phycisphaerae bacterium]